MATEVKKPDANTKPASNEPDINLDNFSNVNPEESRSWWNRKQGSIVYGEWVGRFEKTWDDDDNDASKFYHQIRLWHPADAKVPNPDGEGKSVETILPKGQILNVDESKMLEALASLPTEDGGSGPGKWILYIKCMGKEPVKGTKRTVWRFDVRKKPFTAKDSPF